MSNTDKKPLSKDELAKLLLKNLRENVKDPEALENARLERENRVQPLELEGDIVPMPPLHDDGSLRD